MSSKEYYFVPVYIMLVEDFGFGAIDFFLLDNIIVSKTKESYEELNGFNNFFVLKSEKCALLYNECYESYLYLNADDFNEEHRINCGIDDYNPQNFNSFIKKNEKVLGYYNLNR